MLKTNHSNRIRKVSTTIEEIPHWCNTLRDLVQEQITVILNQPSASEKKEKEAEERRKKKIHEDCVCYSCIFNKVRVNKVTLILIFVVLNFD